MMNTIASILVLVILSLFILLLIQWNMDMSQERKYRREDRKNEKNSHRYRNL